jgi:hypothetical protein
MSVPVVSGGQCGELYGLLESLNDLSAVGSPGMPSRYFNVTKKNRGDINEHWELTANGAADNDEAPDKDKDIESEEKTYIRRDCLECAHCRFSSGFFTVKTEWWHDKRFWDRGSIANFRSVYICNMMSLYEKLAPLHHFRMTDMKITEQDVLNLCTGLQKHRLYALHLDNVNLDDDGVKHIMRAVFNNYEHGNTWNYLQTISLKGNTRISATVKQSFLKAWTPTFGMRTSRSGEPFRLYFD